jgi:hypothetical protein
MKKKFSFQVSEKPGESLNVQNNNQMKMLKNITIKRNEGMSKTFQIEKDKLNTSEN